MVKSRILNIFKRSKRGSLDFLILRSSSQKGVNRILGRLHFLAFPSIKIEKHKLNFHVLKLFFHTEYSCFHIKYSGNIQCREEISANYVVVTNFENNVHLCLFLLLNFVFCTSEIQQNLCVEGSMERIRRNGRRMDRRGLRKYCKKGMSGSIRRKSSTKYFKRGHG